MARPLPASANIPTYVQAVVAMIAIVGGTFLGLKFQPAVGVAAILAILLFLAFLAALQFQRQLIERDAPFRPAIKAVREEIALNLRLMNEWTPPKRPPELYDAEWNQRKNFLRENLDESIYEKSWNAFIEIGKFNRERPTMAMGPGGFDTLCNELEALDRALEGQL
jgi:hypothetical protein